MFSQLLQIFRKPNSMSEMASLFTEMLETAHKMNVTAGRVLFDNDVPQEDIDQIYRSDVRVNKAERKLRKLSAAVKVFNARGMPGRAAMARVLAATIELERGRPRVAKNLL